MQASASDTFSLVYWALDTMALRPDEVALSLSKITGYWFIDPLNACSALVANSAAASRLRESTIHRSFSRITCDGNKQLALLGEGLLHFVIVERGYDYDIWPGNATLPLTVLGANMLVQGTVEQTISSLLSDENLSTIARAHGLPKIMFTEPSASGSIPVKSLATAVAAILGAVYLDSNRNLNDVKEVIRRLEVLPNNGSEPPILWYPVPERYDVPENTSF